MKIMERFSSKGARSVNFGSSTRKSMPEVFVHRDVTRAMFGGGTRSRCTVFLDFPVASVTAGLTGASTHSVKWSHLSRR